MTERSFVMVKPDGVGAGLTGEIVRASSGAGSTSSRCARARWSPPSPRSTTPSTASARSSTSWSSSSLLGARGDDGGRGGGRDRGPADDDGAHQPLEAPPGHGAGRPSRSRSGGTSSTAPTAPSRPPASWRCTSPSSPPDHRVILLASRSPQRRRCSPRSASPSAWWCRDRGGRGPPRQRPAKAHEVAARGGVPRAAPCWAPTPRCILDGRALGKPADEAAARRELAPSRAGPTSSDARLRDHANR